ncbi:MAG: LysR family transcriptional regulator [Spirochaetales bacterium]|nr:LysR family transcriptional regulator [Spirochaetales bacterium]
MKGFADSWEAARFRSRVYRVIRDFFLDRGFLEAETPLLSPDLIPESAIEVFKTEKMDLSGRKEDYYLVPSPEIWMKKLLSRGSGSLFQISKCFRNSEQSGRIHSNEFSMLEWYAVDRDYRDNITLTAELFQELSPLAPLETRRLFTDPFLILTMDEAFLRYAGFSLGEKNSSEELRRELNRLGIPHDESDDRETLFNRIFLSLVEPSLPRERAVILIDYPAFVPTLARSVEGTPWCERWEMYIGGVELSNCFSEETDREKVTAYYDGEGEEKRKNALVPHRTDRSFPALFHRGYPRVSGNAMGLDRLIMALSGEEYIDRVLLFP